MRAVLIRDPNKLVALSVLSSPKLTETEVEAFARMGSVGEDVLRTIARTRTWMKNYTVVLALAKNERGQLVAAVVERDASGVTVGEPLHPAGARTSPVSEINFDRVVLPESHVFRPMRNGQNMLRKVLTAEKILGAFPAIGLMEGVLSTSLDFVRDRSSAGRRLTQLQYVQHRLTEMRMNVEMIRGFAHFTLRRFAAGEDVTLEAAALKHQAMKLGVETGLNAIKLCGSHGLQEESRLTMAMLDGLAGTIGGGTEEAQRLIVYAEMIRRSGSKSQRPATGVATASPGSTRAK